MDALTLARWQFAVTTVYHFFFVPLTLGLVWAVAILQTAWVVTGKPTYLRLTKFWGKLFLINFAMGVVTGIVQEFQFGMNWSEYSRFVGDVFGAPLAIEALLAFFLESTFLGVWIFGWDRLPKKVHLATIWLVALGSNLSAIWILIANSFMQQPVGYVLRNGRAEMDSFLALITNPHVFVQFPHVVTGGMATAAFFMLGISAWHLRKQRDPVNVEDFRRSFRFGAVYALVATVAVMLVGHTQAQYMMRVQPMKMAAAEALWETENPAPMSLFTWGNEPERRDVFAVKVPGLLSFLAYNDFTGEVRGIKQLQAEYEQRFGPGEYAPPVKWTYWTFRGMVGAGMVMLLLAAAAVVGVLRERFEQSRWLLAALVPAIALPYIANSTGWIFTEIGRQPWIVFGLQKTADAVSPNVLPSEVLLSLVVFTLLYGALMGACVYLLRKYARAGTVAADPHGSPTLEPYAARV
ncbi:MAG TPA: cytochrome ubiquinol oxidase subunit I [Gemmatimonadales bacterium]|nr:cytochrome ubiquinol oxidase subunit I [Gemmatimonadales bacterium]